MTDDPDAERAAALDATADALYALPLEEFTAARDARVREARASGDRELAAAVAALRKPTTSAWLGNLLARDLAPRLDELLALGATLREAQAALAGPELRALTAQRHRVVSALAAEARRLARERGQAVSGGVLQELEATLEAALADPAAGDAVASGRLTRALSYAGLGGVDLEGATATGADRDAHGPPPATSPRAVPARRGATGNRTRRGDREEAARARAAREQAAEERAAEERAAREARRAAARTALGAAEDGLADAERDLADHDEAATRAREAHARLAEEVADLAARLARAEARVGDADRESREAQEARDRAATRAHEARRAHDEAAAALAAAGEPEGDRSAEGATRR